MKKTLKTKTLIKVIEKYYNSIDLKEFMELVKKEDELILAEEKKRKKEEAKTKYIENQFVYSDEQLDDYMGDDPYTPEDFVVFLEELIHEELDDVRYDIFSGEDIPDEGVSKIDYAKINDKFYQFKISCEAEWVGDWSVRANTVGRMTISELKELKCKVIDEDKIKLLK